MFLASTHSYPIILDPHSYPIIFAILDPHSYPIIFVILLGASMRRFA